MAESDTPMANPGGESTMLGRWRIVLRQAEEAANAGRYEEAYALASQPDVADHLQAVQFRNRLGLDLVARADRRARADDLAGAVNDLDLAERLGASPDSLAAARLSLADRLADEIRSSLEACDPSRALERIEELARQKIGGPALRRYREIAEAWHIAIVEARRGEFGRAHVLLDRAERLAAGAGMPSSATAVGQTRHELESRQQAAVPRVEALYAALAEAKWPQVLTAAEQVLAVVPEHPTARQARAKAWQQIAVLSPHGTRTGMETRPQRSARTHSASPPSLTWRSGNEVLPSIPASGTPTPGITTEIPSVATEALLRNPEAVRWQAVTGLAAGSAPEPGTHPPPHRSREPVRPLARADSTGPRGRLLLWVDTVGGYLMCLDERIILGRAGPDSPADVPLMGDLSRNHAILFRSGDSYVLQAHHASFVNGKPVSEQACLRDGDVIRLGSTVELEFRQPSPVSATARLTIVSRHRLPLAVDGVVLMAETCIVGKSRQAHIPAPTLEESVILYRQGGALWCRAPGTFEVDGRTCVARAPLTLQSSVLGEGFSFSLEPLPSHPV